MKEKEQADDLKATSICMVVDKIQLNIGVKEKEETKTYIIDIYVDNIKKLEYRHLKASKSGEVFIHLKVPAPFFRFQEHAHMKTESLFSMSQSEKARGPAASVLEQEPGAQVDR